MADPGPVTVPVQPWFRSASCSTGWLELPPEADLSTLGALCGSLLVAPALTGEALDGKREERFATKVLRASVGVLTGAAVTHLLCGAALADGARNLRLADAVRASRAEREHAAELLFVATGAVGATLGGRWALSEEAHSPLFALVDSLFGGLMGGLQGACLGAGATAAVFVFLRAAGTT